MQVLNAVLLGCAGEGGPVAVAALEAALQCGAVPDTWAPNGSSVSALPSIVRCISASVESMAYQPASGTLPRSCAANLCGLAATVIWRTASDRREVGALHPEG